MDVEEKDGSGNTGSPKEGETGSGESGESTINLDDFIPKSEYVALETKLGEQGQELGDLRKFYADLSPLLDKLDAAPEVVEALRDGKLDSELAKAILEGRIGVLEATEVVKANDEIKKDMSDEAYKQIDPDVLAKQIMDKVTESLSGVKDELKKDIEEVKTIHEFEKSVADFIAATPDYGEYAEGITEYLEEHPDQENLEMIYHYVKGKALTAKAAAEKTKSDTESSKSSVPQGSESVRTAETADENPVEQFVRLSPSANSFETPASSK